MVAVIIYNSIGLLMTVPTMFLASFVAVYLPRHAEDYWTLVGGWSSAVFVWDVIYRIYKRDEHWYSPNRGGHIFFIPVFLIAGCGLWWYSNQAVKVGYWLPRLTPDPTAPF